MEPPLRRFRVLFAAAVALFPAAASAQVNIERMRGAADAPGFSSTVAADLSLRSGNVDVTELSGEIRTDLVRNGPHGFLLGRGGVGWKDGDRFSNSGLLHLRAGLPARPAVELEAFAQIDYDKARRLDFRALAGAGPRVRLASGGAVTATAGTAYLREHEEYGLPPAASHPRDVTVSRWSSYLNLGVSADPVSAVWIVYAQPRFDRFDDVRVLSEASLSVAMGRKVELRNVFRLRWDSVPPDGIEETDVALVTGISVRL